MAVSRKLLNEGEHIILSTRTHVKALLLPTVDRSNRSKPTPASVARIAFCPGTTVIENVRISQGALMRKAVR